jgi:5-methyltetrahydrofolate--homocysteine methyltransferase
MLKDIIDNKKIEARAILGFYPCNSDADDDIEVYDETNEEKTFKAKFCTLR